MRVGLLTDRINNALEKSNLINEHALNREPVPLTRKKGRNLAIGCSLTQTNLWPLLPAQCQYLFSVLLFSSGLLNNTASGKFAKRTVSS